MKQHFLTCASVILLFAGCEQPQSEPQSEGSIHHLPESQLVPGRIWFFKVIGSTEPAPSGVSPAIAFWKPLSVICDTLAFNKDDVPTWTLPPGWSQKTVIAGRCFDLVDKSGNRIEIKSSSVSDIASEKVIKTRLNLWRDELGLSPLPESGWPDTVETGVSKSLMSGRTNYIFQFEQASSSETSATIIGAVIPHPDPTSSN